MEQYSIYRKLMLNTGITYEWDGINRWFPTFNSLLTRCDFTDKVVAPKQTLKEIWGDLIDVDKELGY